MKDMKKTALIVGNDHDLSALIKEHLESEGFGIFAFFGEESWQDARYAIMSQHPDLVVLDIAVFNSSGFDACREIRAVYNNLLLVFTNRENDLSQALAFELGADDVINKPVSARLLQARLRAHLRRSDRLMKKIESRSISIGDLTINAGRREAYLLDEPLDLTTLMFNLLWYLVRNAGQIVTREDLCRAVFNAEYNGVDRSIDVYISRLRQRIERDPSRPCYLKTVRGEGYLFAATMSNEKGIPYSASAAGDEQLLCRRRHPG